MALLLRMETVPGTKYNFNIMLYQMYDIIEVRECGYGLRGYNVLVRSYVVKIGRLDSSPPTRFLNDDIQAYWSVVCVINRGYSYLGINQHTVDTGHLLRNRDAGPGWVFY